MFECFDTFCYSYYFLYSFHFKGLLCPFARTALRLLRVPYQKFDTEVHPRHTPATPMHEDSYL